MARLIGIVVPILLVASAGFRKFVLGLVALGAAAGRVVYLNKQREQSRSLSRIPVPANCGKRNAQTGLHQLQDVGASTTLPPKFTLKQVAYIATMQDCTGEPPSKNCVTIGESRESIYLDVPPGQARDFEDSVYGWGRPQTQSTALVALRALTDKGRVSVTQQGPVYE